MWNQKTGEKLKQKNGVSTSWPRDIRGQRLGHIADRCIHRGKTVVRFREMSVILPPPHLLRVFFQVLQKMYHLRPLISQIFHVPKALFHICN